MRESEFNQVTFSQKHYVTIAAIVKHADELGLEFAHEANSGRVNPEFSRGWNAALDYLASQLANEFARDNSRFDRDRFLKAAGHD